MQIDPAACACVVVVRMQLAKIHDSFGMLSRSGAGVRLTALVGVEFVLVEPRSACRNGYD